jgi:SAM-dependent methyltransferase
MGLLQRIQRNNRAISDALAGSMCYLTLWTTSLALYRVIAKAAPRAIRGRLLDAGAGRQAYRLLLTRYAHSIDTLDIEPFGGRTDHVADIQHMPLPDATYDSVFCTQVLHHVPEPMQALREIARVLKPGGTALISVPHLSWLHNEPHDYFRFTIHGLRHMLAAAELAEVEIRPAGGLVCFLGFMPTTVVMGLLWPARWLFRLILPLNAAFVRLCLLLDRMTGTECLYPVNYVVIAGKPGSGRL